MNEPDWSRVEPVPPAAADPLPEGEGIPVEPRCRCGRLLERRSITITGVGRRSALVCERWLYAPHHHDAQFIDSEGNPTP